MPLDISVWSDTTFRKTRFNGLLPFEKEPFSLYAYQMIVAGALCKKLAIPSLFVPSYNDDGKAIPDVAVVVKHSRKAVFAITNGAVDTFTPFSEMSEKAIRELAKKYHV